MLDKKDYVKIFSICRYILWVHEAVSDCADLSSLENIIIGTIMDKEYIRVDEDDPQRCQGITAKGQCHFKAVDGVEYCPLHGANRQLEAKEKEEVRNLMLSKYRAEIRRLGSSDHVMSLRDEIGVLRMMLERILNSCRGDADLLLFSPQLSELVMKIGKIVTDCHKIEERTGQLLSREELGGFALKVIELVNTHVKDVDAKRAIGDGIMAAIPDTNSD